MCLEFAGYIIIYYVVYIIVHCILHSMCCTLIYIYVYIYSNNTLSVKAYRFNVCFRSVPCKELTHMHVTAARGNNNDNNNRSGR